MEGALTMRKGMIVPVLLLSLLLTACGGAEAGSDRNSFWEELGVNEEETALIVDGREVPAWRYCYWLALACDTVMTSCADAGLEPDWDMPLETGTLAQYVQQQALEDTVLYAVVENRAEEETIVLMTEPSGAAVLKPAGFPMEEWQLQELDAVGLRYREMIARIQAAEDERLERFAQEEGYVTVRRIAFPAGEDREAARQRAEETFVRINQAADKETVFDALADAEGAPAALTLRLGDGTLTLTEENAAAGLGPGQNSGILETESGFSILRRLPQDREELAPLWLESELLDQAAGALVKQTEVCGKLTAEAVGAALSAEKRRETA